jgi:glycolate oxidase FAD binding subunit
MIYKPTSDIEVAELVRDASNPFEIIGTGTKHALGRPMGDLHVLDLSKFSTVKAYEPEELILDVGAGTKLKDIEKMLTAENQQLAFEPPNLAKLFGAKHSGSIGGILACNLSGPRRLKSGAARDHILGLQGVSGRGEIFKAGARVVKNVTGYDVPKLMAGSYGTLAALTSVIFKVLPRPESEETLVIAGLDDETAVQSMCLAVLSSADVSGAAHISGEGTYLRLEGIAASVSYRRDKLVALLGHKTEILNTQESTAQWQRIRDVLPLADNLERVVWKISVPPTDGPVVIKKLKALFEFRYYYDWAGGLIWLDCVGDQSCIIRAAIDEGHAMVMRAPSAIRARCDVFQPQAPSLAALSSRVKTSFDPKGLFNPGRMYGGV